MSVVQNTPILIIVFNRPDTTQEVFEYLKKIQPSKLYVAADGPRENKKGEAEKCQMTRNIFSKVDWPCEVKTLFQEKNLGCGKGVFEAISWFFKHEEQGIILEDDIIPDYSFYDYCTKMLNRYKTDSRVMQISGYNYFEVSNEITSDYFYSFFGSIWGWATWRRAWQLHQNAKTQWNDPKYVSIFAKRLKLPKEVAEKRLALVREAWEDKIDTWDYQWSGSRIINNGLSVVPRKNLIKNIGFGDAATHTINESDAPENKVYSIHRFHAPNELSSHLKYDHRFLRYEPTIHESRLPNKIKQITHRLAHISLADIITKFKHQDQKSNTKNWQQVNAGTLKHSWLFTSPVVNQVNDEELIGLPKPLIERLKQAETLQVIWSIGIENAGREIFFQKIMGKHAKLFSFDPNEEKIRLLEDTYHKNKLVPDYQNTLNIALGNENKRSKFIQGRSRVDGEVKLGYLEGASEGVDFIGIKNLIYEECIVEQKSIDNILKHGDVLYPELILINVLVGAQKIISGMVDTLSKFKPELLIYCDDIPKYHAILHYLTSLDYKVEPFSFGNAVYLSAIAR